MVWKVQKESMGHMHIASSGSCCNALLCSAVTWPPAQWVKLGSRSHKEQNLHYSLLPLLDPNLLRNSVQLRWPGCSQATAQCCRGLIILKHNTLLASAAGSPGQHGYHTVTELAAHSHCTNTGSRQRWKPLQTVAACKCCIGQRDATFSLQ